MNCLLILAPKPRRFIPFDVLKSIVNDQYKEIDSYDNQVTFKLSNDDNVNTEGTKKLSSTESSSLVMSSNIRVFNSNSQSDESHLSAALRKKLYSEIKYHNERYNC